MWLGNSIWATQDMSVIWLMRLLIVQPINIKVGQLKYFSFCFPSMEMSLDNPPHRRPIERSEEKSECISYFLSADAWIVSDRCWRWCTTISIWICKIYKPMYVYVHVHNLATLKTWHCLLDILSLLSGVLQITSVTTVSPSLMYLYTPLLLSRHPLLEIRWYRLAGSLW